MEFINHFDSDMALRDLRERYDLHFADVLIKNHYKVYLFGGSLRDMVMGRDWKDADIRAWIELPPNERDEKTEKLLLEAGEYINSKSAFGPSFTVFRFLPQNSKSPLGIDLSVVSEQWLVGPDFTINGLLLDLETGELIDRYNSISDIEKRIIRTAKEPSFQFTEEPYVLFRVIKSACQFNFAIEDKTFQTMKDMVGLSKDVLDMIAEKIVPGLTEWFLSNVFTGLKYDPALYEHLWNETGLTSSFLSYTANKLEYKNAPERLEGIIFEKDKKYEYEEAISLFLSAVARTIDTTDPQSAFDKITTLFSIKESKQYQDFLIDTSKVTYR